MEMLTVFCGKLFCDTCRMVIALKKSNIKDHLSSQQHVSGKDNRKQQDFRQQRVMQSWENYGVCLAFLFLLSHTHCLFDFDKAVLEHVLFLRAA